MAQAPENATADSNSNKTMATEEEEKVSTQKIDLTALLEDGKNSKALICEVCGSKILLLGKAEHETREIFLPFMKKKSEQQKALDGETLTEHWVVADMFTFENVGFTNTVNNAKFLICADCEIGPIGWHSLEEKNKFFVAVERVKYE